MKLMILPAALALALVAGASSPAHAKGCITGALVGGAAGSHGEPRRPWRGWRLCGWPPHGI